MDRLLVPLEEAMHQLGIGRTKLYELIDEREIVRVNIGRRSFVLSESIAAYVDRLSAAAVEQSTMRTDDPCEAGVERSTLQCTDPSPPRATA